MIDHELTDPTGSALTITHNVDGVWVTATDTRDEVTVGPFPVTSLTEAVTVESDAEVSGDLMDGGVTAAAIEAEVVSPERARSLVQENTELRARIGRVEEARDLYRQDVWTAERREQEASDRAERAEKERDRWREYRDGQATENPRPLTADDITDEMVQRGNQAWSALRNPENTFPRLIVETIIRAALTPPPSRPEGAEEIERLLTEGLGDFTPPATPEAIADLLAERGVRVAGAES